MNQAVFGYTHRLREFYLNSIKLIIPNITHAHRNSYHYLNHLLDTGIDPRKSSTIEKIFNGEKIE